MSNENVEKLKIALATYLVYHEKAVNHEILSTMQIPTNYILEKYPDEIDSYIQILDKEYGMGPANVVTCKECIHKWKKECPCYPFTPDDTFYCAKGDENYDKDMDLQ